MEWSKVKNIIILLLVLVNGFLLVLVGVQGGETRRYQDSALTQAVEVLERNGIQVDQSALGDLADLTPLAADRDIRREEELAGALLGESVVGENQGGGLYQYAGSRGTVAIRAGGTITARMEPDGTWTAQDDPGQHAAALLESMGVEARLVEDDTRDGSGTVRFQQLWQEAPLFSGQVSFTYQAGTLTGMEGRLLIQAPRAGDPIQGQTITLSTALLRFLDEILASGDVCSAVEGMEPGYLASQDFSGSVQLSPAWLITGNTARYYLNAVTGEVTRAP